MSGISISGTDVANYDLQNFTATTTANITPKPITSSYTASNKVYDQTVQATVNGFCVMLAVVVVELFCKL